MFERTLRIIDENVLAAIQSKKVLLVGVGGVGGSALEGLIRMGFLHMTIVDHDVIDESNLNRQIITDYSNLGKLKVEEAKKRCEAINPNCTIEALSIFIDADTIDTVFQQSYDYILDACDTISTKFLLIQKAMEKHIPILSSMGTGNRMDPTKLCITMLNKTYNDPLAKAMRSILKKNHVSLKIPVIWSSEIPVKTKTRNPGSIITVPLTAGMLIAYYLLEDIKKTTN